LTKEIQLTQGKIALVDDEDYNVLQKLRFYAVNNSGWWYAVTHLPREGKPQRRVFMHRLILNPPKNKQVDHINGNTLDNRRCNLRLATNSQNHMNSKKYSNDSLSQYKGVSWNSASTQWFAQIMVNQKLLHIGTFASEVDAAHAYDDKARELFGEFARLNFIEVTKHE
jgi:hypothetical protein